MNLPKILAEKPQLPSHKFIDEKLASFAGVSYADVFNRLGQLQDGYSVIGYHRIGKGNSFMVMFETPTGEEIYFHYSEGIADWLFA
jgi:hypothetical protein